ncbi:MAG: hypothetical protein NC336_07000 [Clostridium sp.]|nr:hypothetical protein [Clostridium sp.]
MPGFRIEYILGDATQGGGEEPDPGFETKTGVVTEDKSHNTQSTPLNSQKKYSGSQTLYTADEMGNASENAPVYTITKIEYPTNNDIAPMILDLKVYMKTTSETVNTGILPIEEFTRVFSGTINTADLAGNSLEIELDKPFLMNNGEGLVIAVAHETIENDGSILRFQDWWPGNGNRAVFYQSEDTPCDFTGYVTSTKCAVGMVITYVEGDATQGGGEEPEPEPTFVDLTVNSFTGSTKLSHGAVGKYSMIVKNEGTETASGYKVEIFDVETDETLAMVDGDDILAGFSKSINAEVTFAELGTFTIGARAVIADDKDETNNVAAETITVEVIDKGFLPETSTIAVFSEDAMTLTIEWINTNYDFSGSQLMIPADQFGGMTRDMQLQKIGVQVSSYSFVSQIPVKVSLAQTDILQAYPPKSSLTTSDLVPVELFTEVFDGTIEVRKNQNEEYTTCWIELDAPFVLERGKNLVVNIVAQSEDGAPQVCFRANTLEDYMMTYFRSWKEDDLYSTVANGGNYFVSMTVPVLEFQYGLMPLPEITDLEALSITLPEAVKAEEEVSFRVTVANVGTLGVEEFTVELLDMTDEANPVVLVSQDFQRMLAAEGTTNVNLKHTFAQGGEYRIAARVVNTGDSVADNDQTETYTVVVDAATAIDAVAIAEGISFEGGRLTVANASAVRVVDLAGRTVAAAEGDTVEAGLTAGVYVVVAETAAGTVTTRISIR